MTDSMIELENLSYSYKSDWTSKRHRALHGISLKVRVGESFGFLGHNGAGKTTTIKCILGLIRPSGGTIRIDGKDHRNPQARRAVGYLPEQPYFYDHLTVFELMEMYGCLVGLPRSEIGRAVTDALERVGMQARLKSPMRSLSKGLTQRVGMAQALLGEPRLLILDEPFSGLDPIGRRHFKDLLFELKAAGTTIFISSHILGDIEFLCDRASIMATGEIRQTLSLSDLPKLLSASQELILRNFGEVEAKLREIADEVEVQDRFLCLRFQDRSAANRALAIALESTAVVESFQSRHGSLEDLFVQLVDYQEVGQA